MKQELWIEKMMLLESLPRAARGRLEDYVEDLKRTNDILVVRAYRKGLREGEKKVSRKKV